MVKGKHASAQDLGDGGTGGEGNGLGVEEKSGEHVWLPIRSISVIGHCR